MLCPALACRQHFKPSRKVLAKMSPAWPCMSSKALHAWHSLVFAGADLALQRLPV